MERRLFTELMRASERARTATSAADLLGVLIARVAEVAEHHPMLFKFVGTIGAESIGTSPRVEEALRRAYTRLAEVVEKVLRDAQRERSARSGLDVECAAQLFLGMYMGAILHQRLFRTALPLRRAMPAMVTMMEGTVLAGRKAGRSSSTRSRSRARR